MFLRRHRKVVDEVSYDYWTLCESHRTASGPRQRVVATLGKLDSAELADEAGWEDLGALLEGRARGKKARQAGLGGSPETAATQPAAQWEVANVAALRVGRVRDFGEVWLGLALWHRLGLGKLIGSLVEPGKEEVPWADIAAVLTVARFCAQRSELGIAEHWYGRTALEDITGVPLSKINDDRLYRGLDVLGAHKDRLCGHLMERYRDWFGVQFEFLIYDVTSTFFEGQAEGNEKAARGYSRDQRSDCKQVCIGLVCSPEGLPLSFEVFAGNRNDVTTVEQIVTDMERKYGAANRVWVMDRGMVSEKNIAFLRERNARYLVGTPKAQLRDFESALLDKEGWQSVQSGLEARLIAHPDGKGEEQYVLCRSTARAEKERAMLARQTEKLCAELQKIDTALPAKPDQKSGAIERRIGRWLGKYPAAAKVIQATVERDRNQHDQKHGHRHPRTPGRSANRTDDPNRRAPRAPRRRTARPPRPGTAHAQPNPRRPPDGKRRRNRANVVQKKRVRRPETRINTEPASANCGTWVSFSSTSSSHPPSAPSSCKPTQSFPDGLKSALPLPFPPQSAMHIWISASTRTRTRT